MLRRYGLRRVGLTHKGGAGAPIVPAALGSRLGNGTTDRIDFAAAGNLSGGPVTVSAWVKVPAALARTQYILCTHVAGNTNYGLILYVYTSPSGGFAFSKNGPTFLMRNSKTGICDNAWHHILATHDGSFTNRASINLYLGGVLDQVAGSGQDGSGAELSAAGSWSLFGRIYDDQRNLAGAAAQVAAWNRILAADEIAGLAAGRSPAFYQTGLKFYFSGNTDSLTANPGGLGVADGTTYQTGSGNGPVIAYP